MKRILSLILVFVLLFALVACGSKDSGQTPTAPTNSSGSGNSSGGSSGANSTGTQPAKKDTLTLKLCMAETAASIPGTRMQQAIDEFNEYADGDVVIEFYPDNQLGSLDDMSEQLMSGAPVMIYTGAADLCKVTAPKMGAVAIPYILTGLYDYTFAQDTQWWAEEVAPDLEKDRVTIVANCSSGYRHFIGSCPIQHVNDVASHVLRMGPNPYLQGFVSIMGGSPTTSTWADNYTLIQAGTIDACEASIDLLWTSSLYEVCDYLSLTGHFTTPANLAMNSDIFELMTADQQAKMLEIFRKAAIGISDDGLAFQGDYLQKFIDSGITVIYPEDIDIAEFQSYMPKLGETLGFSADEISNAVTQIEEVVKKAGY